MNHEHLCPITRRRCDRPCGLECIRGMFAGRAQRDLVVTDYERGRQDERRIWEKALTDSSLPNLYVRLVRDLATAPCDNCGGDIATCDCDES